MKLSRCMLLFLSGTIFSFNVQADLFAPSLLKVNEIGQQRYHLVWKTPAQTGNRMSPAPTWPEACDIINSSPTQLEGAGKVSNWQIHCAELGEEGLVGERLGVTGLGENQASAMLMVSLLDGRHYHKVLNAEQPDFVIPTKSSAKDVAGSYAVLGMEHIWSGIDHLLFVFGLLLLVGGGSRLLWTITAFTLGHSVTLSLVTLGYFDYPVALVEFIIALSIFVLAVELTDKKRHSLLWRRPWWLAGGFGLLHGMGFAGALTETGLPQDNLPLALLFFNLGIEIGQLVFILVTLTLWYAIRKPLTPWQDRLWPVPVYVLGSLSALWCIERGLETFS